MVSENDKQVRRALQFGEMLTSLPKWIAGAVIAWQAALSIEALTGKEALASFLIRFGRETSVWELVCWAAALAGIVVAIYTGHLLRRQAARENSRIDSIERRLSMIRDNALSGDDASSRESR